MPYCTAEEVVLDFKSLPISDTSTIKLDTVTGYIAEEDALINSLIASRYVTPVTAAGDGLTLLKLFSRSLTANRIKAMLEIKQVTNTDANQNIRSGLSTASILKLLQDIADGKTVLPGADLIGGSSGGAFASFTADNDIKPFFHKNERQW